MKKTSTIIAKLAALAAGAFLLASCASGQESADVTAGLATPFELGVEQTATIDGEELTLTFQEVTEDSRCPTGVNCVWEGQVTTLISVSLEGQGAEEVSLTLREGQEEMATVEVKGYTIELLEVDPYPTADEQIDSSGYAASYVVSSI